MVSLRYRRNLHAVERTRLVHKISHRPKDSGKTRERTNSDRRRGDAVLDTSERTKLLFHSTSSDIHVEDLPSIRVINYEGFPPDERKKLEAVPSILGRDIILKFRTTLTHKKLEMEKQNS